MSNLDKFLLITKVSTRFTVQALDKDGIRFSFGKMAMVGKFQPLAELAVELCEGIKPNIIEEDRFYTVSRGVKICDILGNLTHTPTMGGPFMQQARELKTQVPADDFHIHLQEFVINNFPR